ncbi:hypothetical protein [Mesomycoplasma neurolyticum]|uniref:Uncharacterized protein n=1 Tax=Mesomycoplasma neurolyticum TaxID=2120 RepID=A0A449A5Z0_9BACT|nr:hypothetical protein [Mesomycoplasma neurolyticum]VEU59671.1 Uncharacterised protein [Mesomycoplasma neurolyticum]
MILVVGQIIVFFLWHFFSCLILIHRIKKPYIQFKKTHIWGKIEKFNLLTFNTYVFASLGGLIFLIYNVTTKIPNTGLVIFISIFTSFIYVLVVGFYIFEIYVYLKVKQNPLWLYKEKNYKETIEKK